LEEPELKTTNGNSNGGWRRDTDPEVRQTSDRDDDAAVSNRRTRRPAVNPPDDRSRPTPAETIADGGWRKATAADTAEAATTDPAAPATTAPAAAVQTTPAPAPEPVKTGGWRRAKPGEENTPAAAETPAPAPAKTPVK